MLCLLAVLYIRKILITMLHIDIRGDAGFFLLLTCIINWTVA